MTRIENGYFRSEEDARRYHDDGTDEKIRSGEIKIGSPPLSASEHFNWGRDGRAYIFERGPQGRHKA
jgi:hypothetical protein